MSEAYKFPSVRQDGLILILGLGETGVAAARWCAANGGHLRVLDTRPEPAGLALLQELGIQADLHLGPAAMADSVLDGVHTLVLSPGLSPHEARVAAFLDAARQRSIEIVGEIELFARALADLREQEYEPALVAITGTNGKTTVTALVRHLAQSCGISARAAGNIGPAALDSLRDALERGDLPQVWVLELSSFQLESTASLMADAATVLNISQDHLDWHGSMQAYVAAKAHLLDMSRLAVINRDDPQVLAMVAEQDKESVRSFGAQTPLLAGDMGLIRQNDLAWLAFVPPAETLHEAAGGKRRARAHADMSRRSAGEAQVLMPAEALLIRGAHNVQNVLAALSLGLAIGLDLAAMLHGIRTYRGEAHRTELVRSIAGVDFIDDSKGTNVGATLAALQGLGQPVILIAGGQGKGQDFSPLIPAVREHAKAVFLIGQDASLLAESLSPAGVHMQICNTLEQAVGQAFAYAQGGDAVLLSPACASLDMYRNYAHRSACFIAAVRELAADQGEVV